MYIIFIILLQNYEKATDGQSYRLFWKGLGFNFLKAPGLKKLGFLVNDTLCSSNYKVQVFASPCNLPWTKCNRL